MQSAVLIERLATMDPRLRGDDGSREGDGRSGPRPPSSYDRMSFCVIGTIFTSTRRFAARPASVSFEAIGCVLP